MKDILILGSTGSIGTQAVDVIDAHPEAFRLAGVAAYSHWQEVARQVRDHQVKWACMVDEKAADELRRAVGPACTVFSGSDGLLKLIDECDAQIVLTSLVGAAGIEPTLHAIEKGMDIALANKETLVAAGELVMKEAVARGVRILPVDSEHGAIFQCLQGRRPEEVAKLLVTASGGPHFRRPALEFSSITVEQCLKHPTWNMGGKITIDSATMFNKGLEVIEPLALPHALRQDRSRHPAAEHHPFHDRVHRRFCPGSAGHARYAPAHPVRLYLSGTDDRPRRPAHRLEDAGDAGILPA